MALKGACLQVFDLFRALHPSICYESHLLCPQPPHGNGSSWGELVYGSLLSWGSARVQAVPPSTDVCVAVSATAWHSPPAAPPAPFQAGSLCLSGRCWGHNCCLSLAGLGCHSQEPRALGSDWSLSSGCLILFIGLCSVN